MKAKVNARIFFCGGEVKEKCFPCVFLGNILKEIMILAIAAIVHRLTLLAPGS